MVSMLLIMRQAGGAPQQMPRAHRLAYTTTKLKPRDIGIGRQVVAAMRSHSEGLVTVAYTVLLVVLLSSL